MNKSKLGFVLSGGGSRGAYQCGVWQAMVELGIKPDIVCGVSVGAINGSMVMQEDVIKTANLWRAMETNMIFDVDQDAQAHDFAKEFVKNGGAGSTGLQSILKEYIDEDFIRKSETDFGLLTVEFPSMKPHYMWKEDIPSGMLCDYIAASASAFPAIQPYTINGKEFIDGGYEDNLPVSMARERGASHIIAVNLDAIGKIHPDELKDSPDLTIIESSWDLGDFLVFEKENAKRILRIGYLDAMKTFRIFEGRYYTFVKGSFTDGDLLQADIAAKIFQLDPLILYRKEYFMNELTHAVKDARAEAGETIDRLESSFSSIENSLTSLKELNKLVNRKYAVLVISQDLKRKGSDSLFLSKYAVKLLGDELAAANFLVKNNII